MNVGHSVLGCLLFGVACASTRQDSGASNARSATPLRRAPASSSPTLTYVRTEVRQYGSPGAPYERDMDVLRFQNDTNDAFHYVGQDRDWPNGSMLVERDEVWRRVLLLMICGNGWSEQTIEPGEQIDLIVHSWGEPSRYELTLVNARTGVSVRILSDRYVPPELMVNGESTRARPRAMFVRDEVTVD